MTSNRDPYVYVAQYVSDKDLSDAKRFGELRAVFHKPVRSAEAFDLAVAAARRTMKDYQDGDYLLMIGDPKLCGAAMVIALEYSDSQRLRLLSWDKKIFGYAMEEWDFGEED